jgi:hypothetical protein
MMSALAERYADRVAGVLSCYDRVVATGTLPTVCYAEGMTRFLYASQIRIFDYPEFASTLRDCVREGAESLTLQAGIAIQHVSKSYVRKATIVAKVLERRGEHLASCMSSRRWRPATPTGSGVTSRPTRAMCGRTKASARTTTSTSWTPSRAGLSGGSHMGKTCQRFRPTKPGSMARQGAVPPAILLQRPWLAGTATGGGRHRLYLG